MAVSEQEYTTGSPQVHIPTCDKHGNRIGIFCDDCDEFLCSKCAKTDHKKHDWDTLATVASQKRRGLLGYMTKIKGKKLPEADKNIEKISSKVNENEIQCSLDMDKLHRHYEQTIERMTEMSHEQTLRENLTKNNEQGNSIILKFNKARKELVKHIEFMEENACFMSDYNLIANNRELKRTMTDLDFKVENCEYSARYMRGKINDDVMESIIGHTLELKCINATETNSFQHENNTVFILEAVSEDCCYIRSMMSKIRKVSIEGKEKYESGINAKDVCVKADDCVYYTDYRNKCISSLSTYGYLSTIISTKPLTPGGICLSLDGGLLVTLTDELSDTFKLQPCSRRLVRHLKMNGDLIHDYEYREDGRTRIFIQPTSVAQNGNRDICVVNQSGDKKGELVLLSFSGRTKSVYGGQNMTRDFNPNEVICDSYFNILVSDTLNHRIHILSPDGEFLKHLLTENDVNFPTSMSLHGSSLWVGNTIGLVKVFKFQSMGTFSLMYI